jgi:hypothetical protein
MQLAFFPVAIPLQTAQELARQGLLDRWSGQVAKPAPNHQEKDRA